jgi:small GTP-binding protein
LKEKRPDAGYRILTNSLDLGMRGLVVTRQYPERLRRERGLTDVRILWLSHTPGEDFHNPTAIGALAKVLQKFVEDNGGEGVILLDGLEFLIINNGFLQTLMFVEHVNEFIMQHHSVLLLLVDPGALEETEFELLERTAKVLSPLTAQAERASVMLVPLNPRFLPTCERLQRELDPILAVVDRTREEAANKIGKALRDGITFVVLVDGWAGEGGTYRVLQSGRPMARMTLAELKQAASPGAVVPGKSVETSGASQAQMLSDRARATIASLAKAHRNTTDPVLRDRQEQALWEFATNPIFDREVHDLAYEALQKVLAERPRSRAPAKSRTPSAPAAAGRDAAPFPDTNRLGNVISGWERSDENPDLWHKTFPNGDRASIESVAPNEYRWRLKTRDGKETRGGGRGNLADAAREALAGRGEPPYGIDRGGARRVKVKVCLVGDPATDKTSLIRRFVLETFDDRYITTLGAKVSPKELTVTLPAGAGTVKMDMTIWDIMGHKGFRELLKEAYFYGAKGILAVCDVTRKQSLEDLDDWIKGVYGAAGPVPVVFLANKSDFVDRIQVTAQDLERAAAPYGGHFFFTSSKTGENVEAAFQKLADLIVEARVGVQDPLG